VSVNEVECAKESLHVRCDVCYVLECIGECLYFELSNASPTMTHFLLSSITMVSYSARIVTGSCP
jgi:hypothetical protein